MLPQLTLLVQPTQLVLNIAQIDLRDKLLETVPPFQSHGQLRVLIASQMSIQLKPVPHGHMPSVKLLPHGHKTSSQLTSQLLPPTSIQMDSNIAQTFQRDKLSETVLPSQSSSQQKVPTANKISTQVKKVPQLHTIDRDYCDFEPFI